MADSIRRKRKRALDIYGAILIGGAIVVFFTLFGIYAYFRAHQVSVDQQTLCPLDGPQTLTVVLVDRTDPLTVMQREDLRKRLDDIKSEIEQYGGITIYSVGPIGAELLRPEVSLLCNPGRRKDVNPAFGNPR